MNSKSMEVRPDVAILAARFAALKAGKARSRNNAGIQKKAKAAARRARRSIQQHVHAKKMTVLEWDGELKNAQEEYKRVKEEQGELDESLEMVASLDCSLAALRVQAIQDKMVAEIVVDAQVDEMCSRLEIAL